MDESEQWSSALTRRSLQAIAESRSIGPHRVAID